MTQPSNTYNTPNFIGQLFMRGNRPNTTLQLLGGITGYQTTKSTEFTTGQTYAIGDHATQVGRLEGAVAPDATSTTREQGSNVVQIWQEKISVTYTKEAASGQLSGLNVAGQDNPVVSELDFQTGAKLEYIARNLNYVLVNGVYQKPVDGTTPRKTRGILSAITTNVQALTAGTELTKKHFETSMRQLIDAGAIADGDNVICLANTAQMSKINALYESDFNRTSMTREVGGIRIRTILTAFGTVNFVLEQDLPQTTLAFVNFGAMSLVALEVPNKGVLFREELAKTGAAQDYQIYGELGLNHGPEYMHAKIMGLKDT